MLSVSVWTVVVGDPTDHRQATPEVYGLPATCAAKLFFSSSLLGTNGPQQSALASSQAMSTLLGSGGSNTRTIMVLRNTAWCEQQLTATGSRSVARSSHRQCCHTLSS